MKIDTKQVVSISEANQNFSKVAKRTDEMGKTVIMKNNKAKYVVVNIERDDFFELSDDEKIDVAAKRILTKYHKAFEELAK